MSCNYAEGLSPYDNKGRLGAPEKFDSAEDVRTKVDMLADLVQQAKHIVVHTGAGISTAAGIPDFRGPKGVWTLERRGLKPDMNVGWDDARPTRTHMALARLVEAGRVQFVITQNIDGLHLRSGIPRHKIAELHGNMFVDQCDKCKKMFVRSSPAPTVGQKYTGGDCPAYKDGGRKCRGKLKDFVLDWEAALPEEDLTMSDAHSMMADLSIVMGSTLQIIPAGNLPTYAQKYQSGRLVICNLQPTKHTRRADLNIHTYVDHVMEQLMERLGLDIPEYSPDQDPVRLVRQARLPETGYIEWTQSCVEAKAMKKAGDIIHDAFLLRKREEKKRKADLIRTLNRKQRREDVEEEEEVEEDEEEEESEKKDNKVDDKNIDLKEEVDNDLKQYVILDKQEDLPMVDSKEGLRHKAAEKQITADTAKVQKTRIINQLGHGKSEESSDELRSLDLKNDVADFQPLEEGSQQTLTETCW